MHPAVTLDPAHGLGEVVTSDGALDLVVEVTDARGEKASAMLHVEVEAKSLAMLSIVIDGPGFVDAAGLGLCQYERCDYQVTPGATVSLRALTVNDSHFAGWSGCADSISPAIAIQVADEGAECVARFTIP